MNLNHETLFAIVAIAIYAPCFLVVYVFEYRYRKDMERFDERERALKNQHPCTPWG